MGESELHNQLKQIGWALLIRKGCTPVGMEVDLPTWEHVSFEPHNSYHVVDAAGIAKHSITKKVKERGFSYQETIDTVTTIYAIEAKASRSDFRKGFVNRGWGKLWIIAPPDVIPIEELPGGVGLYEYNSKNHILKLRSKSAFNSFSPSDKAVKRLENSMIWSGYGYSVHHRIESNKIIQRLFGLITLEDFLENGEAANIPRLTIEEELDAKSKSTQ